MTALYFMTFGTFSGLTAAFPLFIRDSYGAFPGAPDPLTFAFLEPLFGSAFRIVGGPVSDRLGGAKVTQIAGIGLVISAAGVTRFVAPTSLDSFPWFVTSSLAVFFFAALGNASTFKQIPMLTQAEQEPEASNLFRFFRFSVTLAG